MEFALDGSGDEQEYEPGHPDGEDAASGAVSLRRLLTHEPKNPYCPTCQRAKMTAKPARRVHEHRAPFPTQMELVTDDHMVMGPSDAGNRGERTALVILDRGTGWFACYPLPDKSSESAVTPSLTSQATNTLNSSTVTVPQN